MDWLPEQPPNSMKRKREPSEKSKKSKTLKLEEPSAIRLHAPLDSSTSSKSYPFETPSNSILKQLSSSLPHPSSTYTPSEPTISILTPSEPHNSNPSSPPLQQINLSTITLPISKTSPLNEPLSPLSPQLLLHHHITTYPLTLNSQKYLTFHLQHWPNSKPYHYLTNLHLSQIHLCLLLLNLKQNHLLNLKQNHLMNLK